MSTAQDVGNVRWTHSSVRPLAEAGCDPVTEITARARNLVLHAMSEGWSGPPFDPTALAALKGIQTVPCADVADARILPVGESGFQIEFNPNRPKARIRYSIAHEVAHTLFVDCGEQVRYRDEQEEAEPDDWQLEMLCNVAAAELLMPIGSLPEFDAAPLTIERVGELRKTYEVSTEAILLRAVKLSKSAVCAFAASRVESGPAAGRYRIDYIASSKGWKPSARSGQLLPTDTSLAECTAIGFTAKAEETWHTSDGVVRLEAVGVPPYRGRLYPRVIGIARPSRAEAITADDIQYLIGDATKPRGKGLRVIAHIVNDKTPNWGAGFAAVVKRTWPIVQEDFQGWARGERDRLRLGNVHFTPLETNLTICHMISQHGYGASTKPRIRYDALVECLEQLSEYVLSREASVHMPRIGTGQAGGSWAIIEELVTDLLCRRGVKVTVYDLKDAPTVAAPAAQAELFRRT